ncbi:MAG: 50S ribosomal protein L11 methyltransferase [Thermofilum sp.]
MLRVEPSKSYLGRLRALLAVNVLRMLSRLVPETLTFEGVRLRIPRGCFAPVFVSTELIYEAAVKLARGSVGCEVGTGPGSLALAVAKALSCEVVGTDVDELCVRAGALNAALNGLDALFHPVVCPEAKCLRSGAFDFALVNPPYFPLPRLQGVGLAACAGENLETLKEMLKDAVRVLRGGGLLIFTSSSLTGRVCGAKLLSRRWALLDSVLVHLYVKERGSSRHVARQEELPAPRCR